MYNCRPIRQSHSPPDKLLPTAAAPPAGFGLHPKRKAVKAPSHNSTKGSHKIPRRDSQSPKIHTVTDDSDDIYGSSSDDEARLRVSAAPVGANNGLDDEDIEEGKYQRRRTAQAK